MAPRATVWAPRSSTCDIQLPPHLPSAVLIYAADASRGRRQRSGHRPGHHDHLRATKANVFWLHLAEGTSQRCYLASVHIRLVILTTSTTQRTSPLFNPRRPLVSVSSCSRRIRKLLPQLCVCVSRLVTMVCIWCTRSLGRLNFLDLLLRHNALVGGHPGPRKKGR